MLLYFILYFNVATAFKLFFLLLM